MLKSHEKFHSANGKRLVLVVDDEQINRELLAMLLSADYEVLFAENGMQALEKMREYKDTLSLVLLDLLMPVMSGMEALRAIREDQDLRRIPVIVVTSDQDSEVASLKLGASDFIPKPYPQADVILARVFRSIELSEDRQIIQSTERDPLTGLYNREYFYRYAEQFDQYHQDLAMDAIVVDVNHFHMINERFGAAYGDEVLRRIGEKVREMVRDSGGIVCRREGDMFMAYCPHGKDYKAILDNAAIGLMGDDSANNRVRLRMGVYENVDKSMEVERRFDRAKMAADTVRGSFTKTIGIYDITLHERELYAEQLIEDFQSAIDRRQFQVFYQPKFDIRPEIPVLSSAEALVRWRHPELGMISPGVFIPLFEGNGLIQRLDNYVWREAAAQVRDWKERFGFTVPVSVNVSRIDMYDPNLISTFRSILEENELLPGELHLEITESAYTQDSEQIIDSVNQLRELGFEIEMDDFGTGYSSLNMISTLPIDALKLDMQFIRTAFSRMKDTRMLEVIIDIADYLSVPVIAEGVETKEQLDALKAMGCDIVQGYYFSMPVPAEEYEQFMLARRDQDLGRAVIPVRGEPARRHDTSIGKIAYALSSGFESIYYVDTENDHYVEFRSEGKYEDLQIERSGSDFFADTQKNLRRVVYSEDMDRVALNMQKTTLLSQLANDQPFSMTYRLMIENVPTYYNLKVARADTHDNHHIVIGVSNVDDLVRHADRREEDRNELNFAELAQALTSDMESIYYVDADTDTYMEFVSSGAYETLRLELSGENFFEECRRNIQTVVYEEDRSTVTAALEKTRLLATLNERQTLSLDYRLVIDGRPLYYRLKAIRAEGSAKRHIIIGVSNIDAQVTEEQRLEAERQSIAAYSRVAQALARDYFSIYYVDTDTEHFIEYSAYDEYAELGIEKGGEDFFNLSRMNMARVGHPDDLQRFLDAFTKENVMQELEHNGTFTINYRLMFDGEPNYVSMKVTRMGDESDHHIVIGVNNINAQMKRQQEYEAALRQNLTYSRIAQALSQDYYSIYYVNIETDEFIEYSSNSDYQELKVEQSGVDFFEDCRANVIRLVYKPDLDKALTVWEKERLLAELERGSVFSTTYRLMMDGVPVFINCKVIRMDDDKGDKHIVIGVSNVDVQMRREQELAVAQERANRDSLTGVKSKHAYASMESELCGAIKDGHADPFAVAVCDVNGLKSINDTLGHAAGDALICAAAREICNIFDHSPVYRYGGDEFVAVLRGRDYDNRVSLLEQLEADNQDHLKNGGVIVACGMAAFVPGQDEDVAAVFKRADADMYENKKRLKGIR